MSGVVALAGAEKAEEAAVSRSAWKSLWGSAIGYAMDGFDLLILGFILRQISADLSLSSQQGATLVTATLGGTVLGGVIFGMLSDRYGRIKMLSWTIILFAGCTGLCALATGYWDLLLYRTLAGIGLGGEFGIGMALVAEAWPSSKRARASSYVGLGFQTGVLLAALLTPLLLPVIGWRGMFAFGMFPALVAFIIRKSLHEPDVFVEKVQRAKAPKNSLRSIVADYATIKLTVGVTILCSVQAFGYYGVMVWLPNYLATRFGFGLTKSAVWTSVTIAGMAVGIFVFGQMADRLGRRPAFLTYMIGAGVMVVTYSQLTDPMALLVVGAVMGFFVNGMLGGYGTLISELYPTSARATAQNLIFNVGRAVGGGAGPLVIAAVATAWGFDTAIAMLALLYALDVIVLLTLIPERAGAQLD